MRIKFDYYIFMTDILWQEQVTLAMTIGRDDVRFVLDHHAYLDLFSVCSLNKKKQSVVRHVTPPTHIYLIRSQSVFDLST